MVIMLPGVEKKPSFASRFAAGVGAGVQQGGSAMMEQLQKKSLMKSIMDGRDAGPSFKERLDGSEAKDSGFSPAVKAAMMGETDLARVLSEEAKSAQKERWLRESAAEPKLLEMEDKLTSLEQSGLRFDRLKNLFSPELEEKFPSAVMTAAFTKNGELRPTASALLSPEAQESVKLVSDELSGAKNTFGAKVTNFDVQSYMKRLPSLLNTSEGRRTVLRDLQLMNQLNTLHTKGVLDIVDRYGGAGRISLSKANSIFRKEYAPQVQAIKQEFIQGGKGIYATIPQASLYEGRTIKDKETGKLFKSNGSEWIPQ